MVQKCPFFQTFFLRQYRQGICLLRYSRTKKQDVEKVEKVTFSKGVNPQFWLKNGHFSFFFFFEAIQSRERSFTIFQNEKTPFQSVQTRSSKTRKIKIFSKGLSHGYGPKMSIFPNFFSEAIQARNMSFTIFQNKKTPFQGIKTTSSKSRKIDIFPKGLTDGCGPNMAIFAAFFFEAIQARKMSFTIFSNEETSFQVKKQDVQKIEKLKFLQRG